MVTFFSMRNSQIPLPPLLKGENELSGYLKNFAFLILVCLVNCVSFLACGSAWHGRVIYLQDNKAVFQPEGDNKIKPGQKIRIYRYKSITHPVSNVLLGDITDKIGEFSVIRVGKNTVIAKVTDPEFSMMMVDDEAVSVRGSVKPMIGSVDEIGRIVNLDTASKTVEFTTKMGLSGFSDGALTVIKYADTVIPPYSEEVLAIAVKPVAELQIKRTDAEGRYTAIYNLLDEKLGWVEIGDMVVKRTGDMIFENLWFQDTPDGFDESWIYNRNYLHAIRYYNSGLYREAILELDDVIKINPDYKDSPYLLALCYENIARHEDAIAQYKNILIKKPDDAKTLMSLGYLYMNRNMLKEAAEAYEKLTVIIPENSTLWTDLGDIYQMSGENQKAERAYKKAVEIDKNEEARYELGE
jgi:hypothetical protein